jgi:outer membrane protein assembly factor BamB
MAWVASGIGHGYSSVSIANGRIFTAGVIQKQTYVTALDMDGKPLWQQLNGESWEATGQQPWAVPYTGARGTPTVDGETVYHLSELGRLTAFDCQTGDEQWAVNVLQAFQAGRPNYGLSESVLIQGNRLFCCSGGKNGYIVALDKTSGRAVWTNQDIQDPIGYSSPVLSLIDDVEQLINLSAERIFSVAPSSGRLLWQYPFSNPRGNNATDVIVHEGLVFATTGYGGGSILLQPATSPEVGSVWISKQAAPNGKPVARVPSPTPKVISTAWTNEA